jgi:hypothetical protein
MNEYVLNFMQTLFYVISPLVTLMAVSVAYIALVKQTRPHILVHYQPNPGIQTFIDLIVENIGGGMAMNVNFSQPLPIQCFGIEQPKGSGVEVLGDGLPAIAAGQRFVFDGGQYSGLAKRLGDKIELEVSYSYTNPFGFSRNRTELCVLSVAHLEKMPTRNSAEHAIVDALMGPNETTLQKIQKDLSHIASTLDNIVK